MKDNTLIEKLKEAGFNDENVPAEDVESLQQVLSDNQFETNIDYIGNLGNSTIVSSYYSDKLQKQIILGNVRFKNLEDLVLQLEDYEREAEDLEISLTNGIRKDSVDYLMTLAEKHYPNYFSDSTITAINDEYKEVFGD